MDEMASRTFSFCRFAPLLIYFQGSNALEKIALSISKDWIAFQVFVLVWKLKGQSLQFISASTYLGMYGKYTYIHMSQVSTNSRQKMLFWLKANVGIIFMSKLVYLIGMNIDIFLLFLRNYF
jgi:hypothetical protein